MSTEFGPLLRSYRLAAELSQEELAASGGRSALAIGTCERGIHAALYRQTRELDVARLQDPLLVHRLVSFTGSGRQQGDGVGIADLSPLTRYGALQGAVDCFRIPNGK